MPSAPLPLLKPELYTSDLEAPKLKGGECCCGYVFFPMQDFGCEQCGAVGTALRAKQLSSEGRLLASALVRVHKGEGREAPFVVASVQLDEGPVLRTLFDIAPDQSPLPGTAVRGQLCEVRNRDGEPCLDFRFRPK